MNQSNGPAWAADEPTYNSLYAPVPTEQYVFIVLTTFTLLPWAWRLFSNYQSAWRDAQAVLLACLLLHWREIFRFCAPHIAGSGPSSKVLALFGAIIAALWLSFSKGRSLPLLEKAKNAEDEQLAFLRPLIFPCRTTHTRLFPTKHSFSYTYLFVGIPISWRGSAGSLLSADTQCLPDDDTRPVKTWFGVEAEDYLERGTHPNGLHGKLQNYLSSQGVDATRYPHAYLVTAPRVLGFSFNPVSFWYLYNKEEMFSAMILEVNNTFDERRIYFMERTANDTQPETKFKQSWPKDFHVSPFNDRSGSYTVEAADLFSLSTQHKVDNTIVLKSADGKPKIVARVFSTEPAIDARSMSTWQTLAFVLRWWWVGFMTNPRIIREARVLWVKKLTVYYRPEVMRSSISRNATSEEVQLEPYFRQFLHTLSRHGNVNIEYTAAAGPNRAKPEVIEPVAPPVATETAVQTIPVHVLTPAFYGELVRGSTISDDVVRRCFEPQHGQQMVHTDNVDMLKSLIDQLRTTVPMTAAPAKSQWSPAGYLRSVRLTNLLLSLVSHTRFDIKAKTKYGIGDPMSKTSSQSFTHFVTTTHTSSSITTYNNLAFRIRLADHIAFGTPSLLTLYEKTIWLGLVCIAAGGYVAIFNTIFGVRELNSTWSMWNLLTLILLHAWSSTVDRILGT